MTQALDGVAEADRLFMSLTVVSDALYVFKEPKICGKANNGLRRLKFSSLTTVILSVSRKSAILDPLRLEAFSGQQQFCNILQFCVV